MLYCGQELINGNFATAFLPPPPIYYTGPPRNLSPPWRPDDKDGHYVFAVGENLTPRCIFPQLSIIYCIGLLFLFAFLIACLVRLLNCFSSGVSLSCHNCWNTGHRTFILFDIWDLCSCLMIVSYWLNATPCFNHPIMGWMAFQASLNNHSLFTVN